MLLLAVAVPLLVALMSAWGRGWTLVEVRTGSMRPGIDPGAVVVVAPVEPSDIEVGTVIGFRDARRGGAVTVHRVIERVEQKGSLFLRTQGDANRRPDGPLVPIRDVVGSVRWRISELGSLVAAVGDTKVRSGLIAVPLVLLVGSELVERRPGRRRRLEAELRAEIERLTAELEEREPTVPDLGAVLVAP